jgi:hypothetical protein
MPKSVKVRPSEYRDALDQDTGWCPTCEDFTRDCTEPDAEGYDCPVCDGIEVVGAELALISVAIEVDE